MQTVRQEMLLKVYEQETEVEIGPGERLFRTVALCSFLLFGGIGLYLRTHNPPPQLLEERAARARQVSFIIEENKKPKMTVEQPKPKPMPVEKKETVPLPKEPIDLTNKPKLEQKIEDAKPDNTGAKTAEPVRRVYGIRKVYSTGIGAGGSAADAVVGKLGNNMATEIDTFTATGKELKGVVTPVSMVQTIPKVKVQVKPDYPKKMRDDGVQGVINAKILVDSDGKVKKVVVLNDLGYGSKQKVYEACMKLEFEPARLQDGRAVAIWTMISFRFELGE